MVKRETRHFIGALTGVRLESGEVRITCGIHSSDVGWELVAPLDDLGEMVDSLRNFPEGRAVPPAEDPFDSEEFRGLVEACRASGYGSPATTAFEALQAYCRAALAAKEKA